MDRFGDNLKKYRKQLKLNQKQLAEAVGVGQTTIANYEKNIRFPNEDILVKLSKTLDISLDVLLGKESIPHNVVEELITPEALLQAVIYHLDDGKIHEVKKLAQQGVPVSEIYREYLRPIMYHVGKMWGCGEITIAEEHHISSIVERMISVTIPYINPTQETDHKVLLMTVNNDPHQLGLKMLNERLRYYGWRTFYIGNNIPWHSIRDLVVERSVDYILLSMTLVEGVNQANEFIRYIKEFAQVKIIVGGQAFVQSPDLYNRIHADYFAIEETDLDEIIMKINEETTVSE